MPESPARRRQESAAETRRLIVEAARELFATRGYAPTTLDHIAAAAGVAVATVYTSVGPKPALLAEVILSGSQDPAIAAEVTELLAETDGAEIIKRAVAATRAANEQHQSAVELLLTIASTDDVIGAAARQATANYRANIDLVGRRLKDIGFLDAQMSARRAADILWFFLGLGAWRRLVVDNAWSWDETQAWLHDAIHASLTRA